MGVFDKLKKILSCGRDSKNREPSNQNDPAITGEISVYGKRLNITEDDKKKRVALLTPREHDLYLVLLEGFTLKESAEQLSIKYSTANTHMTGIYKKLGVNSRAELIINYRYIDGANNKGP